MPRFDAHYSFECKECGRPNNGQMVVIAQDKERAFQLLHDRLNCSECAAAMEPNQPFTAGVIQLD